MPCDSSTCLIWLHGKLTRAIILMCQNHPVERFHLVAGHQAHNNDLYPQIKGKGLLSLCLIFNTVCGTAEARIAVSNVILNVLAENTPGSRQLDTFSQLVNVHFLRYH